MNEIDTGIALAALLVSAASFFIAQRSAARFKKAQRIKDLLGEKETVTFGALRLLTEGLPADEAERELTVAALVQACVFEDSHRARALLFRVIDTNHARHGAEFTAALRSVKETFDSMDRFHLTSEDLDLSRGRRRLAAVEKVVLLSRP